VMAVIHLAKLASRSVPYSKSAKNYDRSLWGAVADRLCHRRRLDNDAHSEPDLPRQCECHQRHGTDSRRRRPAERRLLKDFSAPDVRLVVTPHH
jgi:hypothetical protein